MGIFKASRSKRFYFLRMVLCLFLSLLFIEIIFKVLTFNKLFTVELIRIILFSLATSTFIAFICSFLKPKISRVIILITVLFAGIYTILQLNFYNFMGNYMSLNAAGDGAGRIGEQIIQFITSIRFVYLVNLLPFAILLMLFITNKKFLIYQKNTYKKIIIMALIVLSFHLLSISTLYIKVFQNPTQIQLNKTLYQKPLLLELSLKQFGTVRFMWRDFMYMINPPKEETITVDKDQNKETKPAKPDYERKINDKYWQQMIDQEQDPIIKSLHEFYINQSITPKNDMTGIFKDKNFILIMIEAFDMMAISEELTPTLYKLSKEGWYFDNYYTPKYSCTTGESEYIALTSIIPSSTVCTPNTYVNNNYSTSIFQLFKSDNYYNTSYHNYSDKYYNRTRLHENMGSIKFYNNDDLDIKPIYGWPSDLNLMEEAIPLFIDEDKFFSFIITSTTHFPYDNDGHYGVVIDHWNKVKDLPYNDKVKRYMAKAIELDHGLEYLLKSLEEKNKLNDTVIALFGDHHPLNMEYRYINEASSIDRLEDFNIDRLPFIIYNSEMEPKVISEVSSTFDILPTIANLFDLNYDPRYYVGKDIFSEEEKIVIFTNGSWITNKAMYFSSTGEYEIKEGETGEEYITEINQKVNNYFKVSNQTLINDYFKYRFVK